MRSSVGRLLLKSFHRDPSPKGLCGRGSGLRGWKLSFMCPQAAQFFLPECILSAGVSFIPSLPLFKAPSLLSCLFPFHSQVPNSFTSYLQLKCVSNIRQSFMPVLVIFCASEREKCGAHCAFLKLYSEPLSLAITYHCQLIEMING